MVSLHLWHTNFTKGVDLKPSGTVDMTLKSTVAAYPGGSGSPLPNPWFWWWCGRYSEYQILYRKRPTMPCVHHPNCIQVECHACHLEYLQDIVTSYKLEVSLCLLRQTILWIYSSACLPWRYLPFYLKQSKNQGLRSSLSRMFLISRAGYPCLLFPKSLPP